jgi:hypothetical protein
MKFFFFSAIEYARVYIVLRVTSTPLEYLCSNERLEMGSLGTEWGHLERTNQRGEVALVSAWGPMTHQGASKGSSLAKRC